MTSGQHRDVVIVGGGHNGLVAAAYLARAGLSVMVLERLPEVGGAIRCASALGALPERLCADLGLDLAPVSRPLTWLSGGIPAAEQEAWDRYVADTAALAEAVRPTLMEPLPRERELRERADPRIWDDLVEQPLGSTIDARFGDDAVRGLAAVGALSAGLVALDDPSRLANRCLLQHLLAGGLDGRRLPGAGMGGLADALARAAADAGAELITSAGVSGIEARADGAQVSWEDHEGRHDVSAGWVLGGVAPWVLEILLGRGEDASTKPEGAQVGVDLALTRWPRLLSGADPAAVFAGSSWLGMEEFHLVTAYHDAVAGRLPDPIPGRLEPGREDLTLSFLGTLAPGSLFGPDLEAGREQVARRVLAELDRRLAEPIEPCLATDADGRPRVEVRLPQDIERELAMPGGHPWHGAPEWPWAPNRTRLDTPAQQWGVQTDLDRVLICGAGSRRGGGISGLGGHSAAQAVLASL